MSMNYDPNKHPCRYCKRRSPTCHGECEDYINWNENRPREPRSFTSSYGKAKVGALSHKNKIIKKGGDY